MAVYLIQGKIGSGKTYYAVYHMLKKYFVYHDDIMEYVENRDVVIITNIDSFRQKHINLFEAIDRFGIEYVFSEEYCNSLRNTKRTAIIYIIDEAQSEKLFHRKFYNVRVFNFFQMCRHFGVDIYMITQDANSLPRELRALPEYVVEAVSRSKRVPGSFLYRYISGDEVFRTVRIPIRKEVFRQYRSFSYSESQKIPSVYTKYVLITLLFFAASYLLLHFGVYSYFSGTKETETQQTTNTQTDPQPTSIETQSATKTPTTGIVFVTQPATTQQAPPLPDNTAHEHDCRSYVFASDVIYCLKPAKPAPEGPQEGRLAGVFRW